MRITKEQNDSGRDNLRIRGFSTLEALIASAIGGILVASLYGGITFGVAVIQNTREKLRAGQVLGEKLETLRLYKWGQIKDPSYLPRTFTASLNPTGGPPFFEGKLTISAAPLSTESYKSDMLQVDATVQWKSLGIERSLNLHTFVSRHGIQNYSF